MTSEHGATGRGRRMIDAVWSAGSSAEGASVTYPNSPSQFEANTDRAREKTEEFTSLAEQAERERRSVANAAHVRPGPVTAFLDRVRGLLGSIRGD
jgi:hypothetical protein